MAKYKDPVYCESKKVVYETVNEAKNALAHANKYLSLDKPLTTYYKCDKCKRYHLTSQKPHPKKAPQSILDENAIYKKLFLVGDKVTNTVTGFEGRVIEYGIDNEFRLLLIVSVYAGSKGVRNSWFCSKVLHTVPLTDEEIALRLA